MKPSHALALQRMKAMALIKAITLCTDHDFATILLCELARQANIIPALATFCDKYGDPSRWAASFRRSRVSSGLLETAFKDLKALGAPESMGDLVAWLIYLNARYVEADAARHQATLARSRGAQACVAAGRAAAAAAAASTGGGATVDSVLAAVRPLPTAPLVPRLPTVARPVQAVNAVAAAERAAAAAAAAATGIPLVASPADVAAAVKGVVSAVPGGGLAVLAALSPCCEHATAAVLKALVDSGYIEAGDRLTLGPLREACANGLKIEAACTSYAEAATGAAAGQILSVAASLAAVGLAAAATLADADMHVATPPSAAKDAARLADTEAVCRLSSAAAASVFAAGEAGYPRVRHRSAGGRPPADYGRRVSAVSPADAAAGLAYIGDEYVARMTEAMDDPLWRWLVLAEPGTVQGLWRRVLEKGNAGRPPRPAVNVALMQQAMAAAAAAQCMTEAQAEALVASAEP